MLEIHAPLPDLTRDSPRRFEFLTTALWAILAPHGETMFWIWNGVPIYVGYRMHFTTLFRDVLYMVEALLAAPEGRRACSFRESQLVTVWQFVWSAGILQVDAEWYEAPGRLESVLAERSHIEMPLQDFLAEWKMPLRRILDALDELGIVITDDAALLERIRRAEAAIPRGGAIYR
jgi:hypothetical protein